MRGRGRVFLLMTGLALAPAAAAEPPYELATEELAPFSMSVGGRVGGLSTDVLSAAFKRADLSSTTRLYPWLRAYRSALDQPRACVYSAVRTPEREALFKWVGPIVEDDWVILVAPDSKAAIASVEDLKKYRTASTPGDSLAAFLVSQGVSVGYTPTNGQLQMLLSGRIDFWATTRARGAWFAARNQVKLRPVLTLRKADMYLACNRQIADSVIDSLNRALRDMKTDGTMAHLESAYR